MPRKLVGERKTMREEGVGMGWGGRQGPDGARSTLGEGEGTSLMLEGVGK